MNEVNWVVVPCGAPDTAHVEIAVGRPTEFVPAYRDYENGARVAKIRTPLGVAGRVRVYLRVDGTVTEAGIYAP